MTHISLGCRRLRGEFFAPLGDGLGCVYRVGNVLGLEPVFPKAETSVRLGCKGADANVWSPETWAAAPDGAAVKRIWCLRWRERRVLLHPCVRVRR